MSYEGYEEYLCENGHYHTNDSWVWESQPKCVNCKGRIMHLNFVDTTNGYGQYRQYDMERHIDEPEKLEAVKNHHYDDEDAAKEEIGFDDEWHEDHYGNKFATKIVKYKPGNGWHSMVYVLDDDIPDADMTEFTDADMVNFDREMQTRNPAGSDSNESKE